MHPIPASRNRPPAATLAGLAAAALVSAVIPAAAGLAFLISLAARRPLVAVAARRWPWLTGRPAAQPHRALTGLTAAWGIGLLAAAAVQGAGALTGGPALTSPAGFAARALIALAAEAILTALTITWLHRSPAPARSATPDPSLPPGLERSSWQQQTAVTCRPMRDEDVPPDGNLT
jgi:hypothetical protein